MIRLAVAAFATIWLASSHDFRCQSEDSDYCVWENSGRYYINFNQSGE